ncbi:hypothetical protein Q1695_007938 [Nippostrongylus brasiliensis]|nr:hypothetical protein Q1695_007938 [Nippostrongylus brasiliensis]
MARRPYDLLFKLLLIGDSGVGKTCILYRFSDDAFNTTFISTIGIDFKIKTIELRGKKIKLQIWDTAGQERFHTITTSYYRGAMGIMLVYDITNAKSFDNIAKWLRNIDEHASEDVVKMLLGNKCDMTERRVVSRERGEKIAKDHMIRFLETSAKANIHVDTAFYELAEAILDKIPAQTEEPRVTINPLDSGKTSSGGLNVPRVLLPYHPTIPVKFLLEVTQPSGGCFNWRSTRPDVVSVTPLGSKLGTCSDKAEVRAAAKAVSGELSAVIFAEDTASGTMLSCGVTVDQISNIRVDTTNKILFVDAAPARMIVEAFNAEGDKFSTLSEIPVDWELSHSGDGRPLRIVPFEQSTYEAPPEIIALENNKKKGYTILVEGVLTGSATLTARFTEPHFVGIKAHSLELTVVANLLLLPAHDLYLPVHAVVPFQVQIVRQSSTEVVSMPSSAYYLKVDSESICSLDKRTSSITALTRGQTNIHLFSQNVDVKVKTGVRQPSTAIYVVDPETIQWTVSGSGNCTLLRNPL